MIQACYEDEEILILDKPPGLSVQPGAGVKTCLLDAVERDFGFRPYLVHRLDKETCGLIIVARDSRSANKWTTAIGSRELAKRYRAVVAQGLPGTSGRLTEPVRVKGELMEADTAYRCLSRARVDLPALGSPIDLALLELTLGTGRTHQIRLHLAQAGAPIIGDDLHGDFSLNKKMRKAFGAKRLLLQAWRLELPGGQVVTASTPAHFLDLFAQVPGLEGPQG